ncbi:hypothetical protein ONS95_012004 [Cadophora gregata]|uniref:uncharacterized protein n=1 Tax=Cadophora gregata TaxID=51156 RepID=UPI0026DBAFA5|nr:uncharacterized protein ONS95_012004 [Cadophora gregata]KAK0117675.1 hypothetical protein ONS95_012004 [Cadophora gregata]KAK0122723.1 hypothetical protein ONS96_009758 [Cadophora gregata f. sp. sojae]
MEDTEYTRLHITPFNAGLLKTVIPPSILPNARNISYHSIVTFPEKGYGYVELPTMDAEKIKKKLNGTILKGTKVRIEKARPEKQVVIEEEEPERPKKERKTKRKRDELPGVDIGERQVKRGWTTPAKDVKKDQPVIKSKYTTGPECLFKTNLPPNVASKGKTAETKPDKKKRKPGKEAIVHEFAKTTKYATFLRGSGVSNSPRVMVEFVEGKGWVDEEGNVVEQVKKSRKIISVPVGSALEEENQRPEPDHMEVDTAPAVSAEEESSNDSNSSEDSDSDSSSDVEVAADSETDQQSRALQDAELQKAAKGSSSDSSSSRSDGEEENDSSSDDSSDDDSDHKVRASPSPLAAEGSSKQESSSSSDESSDDESKSEAESEAKLVDAESSSSSDSSDQSDSDESDADSELEEPQSAVTHKSEGSSGPSLSIKIPDSLTSIPIASSVHPLEALYKRPKSNAVDAPKAAESSFSFFGADEEDEETLPETHLQIPLTPFTQKDFEYRGMRSAAPTPDTAHPNKKFVWPSERDEEDEEAVASSPIRKSDKVKGKDKETEPESDFQKWFYENRGDVRRAWTGRKKAAAKEMRQRENRKRERRDI